MNDTLRQAVQLHQAGCPADALPLYAQVLADEPDHPAALYYGGVAAWTAGQLELAHERLDRVIAISPQPVADAHYHRALALAALGRDADAIADYQAALRLKPGFAAAHNNLGVLLRRAGELAAADASFAAALQIDPAHVDARYNRALTAFQRGDLALAQTLLRECIKRAPDHDGARATLVDVLTDLGERAEALTLARASVKRLPTSPPLCNALGQAEEAAGNADAARAAYRNGLQADPGNATLAMNLALLENESANPVAAQGVYAAALAVRDHGGLRFRRATQLPVIPESEARIDEARASFVTNLQRLRESGVRLDDPLNDFGDTPFYLSYHGRDDDRALLGELARTLRAAAPSLAFVAPHLDQARRSGRPRVGICSQFLYNHSVGRALHAVIAALAKADIDLHLFQIPPLINDSLAQKISQGATLHRLPFDLAVAREHIAAAGLDLLIYPEIGMEALTYYLAHARLARVQWNTLGHPCTSGLPAIDTYVSYAALEPVGNERFYSESLLRLPGLPFPDYPAEPLPARLRDRTALGFGGGGPLLICPQSLFKLMPQFDATLRQVLDECPEATLLLPEAANAGQTAAIQRRFAQSLGAASGRVKFFGRRSRAEFIELIAACDVLLDPFPVGGGISTWDALAAGTPIVTLPGTAMRSRFASAALARAGLTATVAADAAHYSALAVQMAQDREARDSWRMQMVTAAGEIHRDSTAVAEWVAAVLAATNTASA
ncbi:MAG TPA: tetratricopeptide repeat protein [Casimicrobium huifangae]|nr:tetratricopeptide repeat protein [Casimicrobium huifangae]